MQASFVVFKRSQEEILLVCSRDILAATLKRLSMFVLRAKAKLSDATADFALYGVAGNAIESIAGSARPAWTKAEFNDANLVFLYPGAGQPRAVVRACWLTCARRPATGNSPVALAGRAVRHCHDYPADFEAFVPQMLNYESVGGVNFQKGCYPGQEIVARSQFRGTLKRRAYLVHTEGTPAVGQEVFHASDAEQPCGLVAAAAANPSGGFDAIVSMQTAAAVDATEVPLTLGSSTGAALTLLPLPYPLLEDI